MSYTSDVELSYTQEEIAEKEGLSREAVSDVITEFGSFSKLAESTKVAALHQVDFEIPFTNRRIAHISV